MPLLEVTDLVAGYGPIRALDGVSLTVEEAELVAIIGANGAGKTTLLMAISGVVPPRGGRIAFAGRPLAGLQPHEIMRLGVGHSPEGRRIFPRLSVRENLEFVARIYGLDEPANAACEMIQRLGSYREQEKLAAAVFFNARTHVSRYSGDDRFR